MTKKKANNLIGGIVIILVLVLVLGFIISNVNTETGDFITFYAELDGKKVDSAESDICLEDSMRVDVKYTLSGLDKLLGNKKSYSLEVLACKDFDYTVDGQTYVFANDNYTNCFKIEYYDDYFIIYGGIKLIDVLQKKHIGKTVELPPELVLNIDYFTIQIYSQDKTKQVSLSFYTYTFVKGVNVQTDLEVWLW